MISRLFLVCSHHDRMVAMVIDLDTNNPTRLQVQQGTSKRRPYDRQATRSRR